MNCVIRIAKVNKHVLYSLVCMRALLFLRNGTRRSHIKQLHVHYFINDGSQGIPYALLDGWLYRSQLNPHNAKCQNVSYWRGTGPMLTWLSKCCNSDILRCFDHFHSFSISLFLCPQTLGSQCHEIPQSIITKQTGPSVQLPSHQDNRSRLHFQSKWSLTCLPAKMHLEKVWKQRSPNDHHTKWRSAHPLRERKNTPGLLLVNTGSYLPTVSIDSQDSPADINYNHLSIYISQLT